jgi:hypothetical protein
MVRTEKTSAPVDGDGVAATSDAVRVVVADWVARAPRPDLRRPKNQAFLRSFLAARRTESATGGDQEEAGLAFVTMMDEQMEAMLGDTWVEWIVTVPVNLQSEVLAELGYSLLTELGKG